MIIGALILFAHPRQGHRLAARRLLGARVLALAGRLRRTELSRDARDRRTSPSASRTARGAATASTSRVGRGRDRRHRRRLGLRQEHAAAPGRPASSSRLAGSVRSTAAPVDGPAPRGRPRLPGAAADALARRARQRRLRPARHLPQRGAPGAAPRRRSSGSVSPLRRRPAARALRRHGAARRDRPRPGRPRPRCCCSTSRSARSTRLPAQRCRMHLLELWARGPAAPCCWSRTISTRRWPWPTAWSCWAGSPGRVRRD